MRRFDLQSQLGDIYSRYPEGRHRPVIGITGNHEEHTCKLADGYYKQVLTAGGVPVIVPPLADGPAIADTLQRLDGLLLSGGSDINPLFAGEEPQPQLHGINAERDLPELLTARLAFNRQLPILGICRGIQTLAVALGGKVAQDIAAHATIKHSQEADRSVPTHTVVVEKDTTLFNIYKDSMLPLLSGDDGGRLAVNSFHHQAVSEAGPRFRVAATSPDGIIEAVESSEHKPIIGVQWHPECMGDDGMPLFRWLVDEARYYREAHDLHDRILTLDTHCDTPMFFNMQGKDDNNGDTPDNGDTSLGIDFGTRDPRILVDLHKMTEGRLDATIMVAYLPQNGPFPGASGPRDYADRIFDRIERIAAEHQHYLALARTPDDLWKHKHQGRKSIMTGIENGLALEGQLSSVEHFARRGVVYITLCHNGDNDLCDSCRGNHTHGGVSDFGRQVIGEMNRLGLMVDLSHAADESFYDALDISQAPIVCSHSSCRSLCDHPRNLTDDQLRTLARKGGVAQVTLYHGFLVSQGEASIVDAMYHLDHAIRVMGIDHVGLGTDFDGDGGVRGLADASELLQFTRQLLARRYSEADIQKIWGGNFLRVMRQVQAVRNEK